MTDHVIVTDEDSARIITMRRPDKKNALTQGMYTTMADAITCELLTGLPSSDAVSRTRPDAVCAPKP